MDSTERPVFSADATREKLRNLAIQDSKSKKRRFPQLYWIITIGFIIAIWQVAALHFHNPILMPTPWSAIKGLGKVVTTPEILQGFGFTLRRVGIGFLLACAIGVPLGYFMGYSKTFLQFLDPVINSVRLIPVMAWVPLTIVWFGLGDGPTIFLITLVGVFPIMLSVIAGVHEISPDYYNAARSMGAGRLGVFRSVIIPGSIPGLLTGLRLCLGNGWMSVI